MDYHVEDIEDQIIYTLKANSDLAGVEIITHAGQINIQMFLQPEYYEGLLPMLPIIFVAYNGRTAIPALRDTTGKINGHKVEFVLYVCAESLRARQESQRNCYGMLRAIYDSLQGAWPYSTQTLAAGIKTLSGTEITTTNFRAISYLCETGGQDEKLIFTEPKVTVYSTAYTITLGT